MGARIAMMRLARKNRWFVCSETGLHHRNCFRRAAGASDLAGDMRAAPGFVNGMAGMRSIAVMG